MINRRHIRIKVMQSAYAILQSKNDNLVLLGEVDEYEPLSRAAYYKALTKEKLQDMDVVNPVDVDANKKNSNA